MESNRASRMSRVSYYALYKKIYAPRLMAIDLALKTMEKPLSVTEAAELLSLSANAVSLAMAAEKVSQLDRPGFLAVMPHGKGVCRLFARELARGVSGGYRPADIAYIYGLQIQTVRAAFRRLRMKKAPSSLIPALLCQIPVLVIY
ncbi:MAG: hypothetical protein LBR83_09930 [Clostridiales bacterium]|jgi:hypothetical protein|nr:hypothetical protein [Clostridiales bacterium]